MGKETDNILSILATGGTGGGTKWRDIFQKVEGQNRGLRHTRALVRKNTPFATYSLRNVPFLNNFFGRLHLII